VIYARRLGACVAMMNWHPCWTRSYRFDAEKFDMVAVNKKLATLAKRVGRQRRAAR
jgi:hypothetical protein